MSTQLHNQSCYTLLDSTLSIQSIVDKSVEYGYKSVALTDYQVMHGTLQFYKYCMLKKIKPIIGLACKISFNNKIIDCILYAKNYQGYKNLIKISTFICSKNELSFDYIKELLPNLIVVIYGEGGIFEPMLNNDNIDDINQLLYDLKKSIGDFYVAVSLNDYSFWKLKNVVLKKCCVSNGIKCVALSKNYYQNSDDYEAYKVMNGIRLQKNINDKTLIVPSNRFIRNHEEMELLYDKDDLLNSDIIAEQCNIIMEKSNALLPKYDCINNDSAQYLKQLCYAGLKKRLNNQNNLLYLNRLQYELDVIIKMNFQDYFLIVYDFILYSRKHDIYVGPGRGSAAGCLVAYCLGITHVDPIKYNLLFERFLNPQRISMPDIDVDLPDDRRDEVINYVCNKYGFLHVAHIVTYGTLKAKMVLRDVGRVLSIPIRDIDMICKLIPNRLNISLSDSYNESDYFKRVINSQDKFQHLFKIALKLENLVRHVSTHAAGIVMSNQNLSETIPCIMLDDNMLTTQYSMEYLEELGLIKMDFLGLKNLTIIDEVVKMVKVNQPDFNIMKIKMDDEKTFKLIQKGDTVGLFQLESDGMTSLLKRISPKCFTDISATIALYRPGPMDNIPLYLTNRQNKHEIKYLHEDIKDILDETYGVFIYQEQIMQVAQKVAGFSLAKADILRKAMSKKNGDQLLKLKNDFIDGCINNKYELKLAQELYELILKFASYGFNKSHSVAYSLITYQMAYLKANYPMQFYCCLLNSVIGNDYKTYNYINKCRQINLKVTKPNVNYSMKNYYINNNQIIYPISAIKNVGGVGCESILQERNKNGLFEDYYDFVARCSKLNKKIIDSLISCGACDDFKMNRKSMKASLFDALNYASLVRIETNDQVLINLDLVSKPIPIIVSESSMEKCEDELLSLGFYFSNHPISEYKKLLNINVPLLSSIKQKNGIVDGFGIITRIKQHKTKKGDMMAFVGIEDESGSFDLVFMPNSYEKYVTILTKGNYILFQGKKDKEDSCLINQCKKL